MSVLRFRRLSRLSDPRSAREFGDLARRLQGERENAPEEVRPLLEATPDDKLDSLAVRAELRTCGALDYLATVIEERLASNPTSARTLARLVVSIADRLLPPLYPSVTIAQLRAHAWTNLGRAHSACGNHIEALEAFRVAEATLEEKCLEHDRAMVRVERARTYKALGRRHEADAMLVECREIFAAFTDFDRVALVDSIRSEEPFGHAS